jgi:hypothetical protein
MSYTSTDNSAAGITRDQWQHFLDFYKPIEDEVLKSAMQTDFTTEGNKAGQTAAAGVNASRGSLARSLSRSGVALSAEERTAVSRRQQNTLTRSVAQAENTTRRGLKDSRANLLAGVVGIGRGVSNSASSGMQSVADMAAAREAQHKQQKSAASATNLSAAASAASLLISFV